MSYGIVAWRVDLEQLSQYCSLEGELRSEVVATADRAALDRYDDNGLSDIPIQQTIEDLLTGNRTHPELGFQYGYALEMLCPFCGDTLDNDRVYPLAMDSFDEIDRAWAKVELSDVISMRKLVARGAPIKLPAIDDFPSIGYLTATECEQLNDRLFDDSINSKIDFKSPYFPMPVLKQIGDWICVAAQMEQGIICFYY